MIGHVFSTVKSPSDLRNVLDTGCVGGGVWSASPVFIRHLVGSATDWRGTRTSGSALASSAPGF
eukprot:scaffold409464_cov42-Prasinocladus_malaysianus.AAC.1